MSHRLMQFQPLVSVVVPVFNSEKYLSKCIESICGQTYKRIEIILVNDGSIDSSLKIAQEYAKKDSRLKIINQKNSGGIIARKNGIRESKGDYILLEDSDDWLEEDLVEKCVNAINEHKDVDIVKFGYICEPSKVQKNMLNDGLIDKSVLDGDGISQIIKCLLYGTSCNEVWNQMVKKQLFDFNDDIFDYLVHKGEDLQINLQIYQKAKKVCFLKENLYHYVDNPNGITNTICTAKVIGNIKDNIYLCNTRKRIASKLFGHVDEDRLTNMTLSLLSGKIIRILAESRTPKNDLIEIEKNLSNDLLSYISGFDSANLNQNILKRRICVNIIDGNYLNNLKYRQICKLLKTIGKIR